MLARTYELLFERAGLALNQDMTYEDLARILACTSEGLLAQWLDPEAIRSSLTADLTVAMAAVMTVRADTEAPADDLAARFPAGVPFDPGDARDRRLEAARAAADAGLFATSAPTTFTVVGEAIGGRRARVASALRHGRRRGAGAGAGAHTDLDGLARRLATALER
ncbi:MAG TPA: hypothetical protein VJM33_03565 [Microthrixaceae bacterium]|nr:hypothetical protein [Microthrixaceae bacterium]